MRENHSFRFHSSGAYEVKKKDIKYCFFYVGDRSYNDNGK